MIYEKMCTALKAFSTALLKQLDFYISSTFSIVEASFSRAFLAVTQGFLHARRIFDYVQNHPSAKQIGSRGVMLGLLRNLCYRKWCNSIQRVNDKKEGCRMADSKSATTRYTKGPRKTFAWSVVKLFWMLYISWEFCFLCRLKYSGESCNSYRNEGSRCIFTKRIIYLVETWQFP